MAMIRWKGNWISFTVAWPMILFVVVLATALAGMLR